MPFFEFRLFPRSKVASRPSSMRILYPMRYLFLPIALLLALAAQAQIRVTVSDSMLVTSPNPLDLPSAHAVLTNLGSSAARIVVYRTVEYLPAGQSTYFCFSVGCYAPATDRSRDTLTLSAGASDASFAAYLNPAGVEGVSSVRYAFVDIATGNTARVRFRFNATVTELHAAESPVPLVENAFTETGILRLAPGPGIQVWLRDMKGSLVRTAALGRTGTVMDVRGLPAGTYTLIASDGRRLRLAL